MDMSDPMVCYCDFQNCHGYLEYMSHNETVEHFRCETCGILYSMEEVENLIRRRAGK